MRSTEQGPNNRTRNIVLAILGGVGGLGLVAGAYWAGTQNGEGSNPNTIVDNNQMLTATPIHSAAATEQQRGGSQDFIVADEATATHSSIMYGSNEVPPTFPAVYGPELPTSTPTVVSRDSGLVPPTREVRPEPTEVNEPVCDLDQSKMFELTGVMLTPLGGEIDGCSWTFRNGDNTLLQLTCPAGFACTYDGLDAEGKPGVYLITGGSEGQRVWARAATIRKLADENNEGAHDECTILKGEIDYAEFWQYDLDNQINEICGDK